MRYPALHPFLEKMNEMGASDLFISSGMIPHLRVEDKLVPLNISALQDDDMDVLLRELLDESQLSKFRSTLEFNVAIMLDDFRRYRVNLFQQMHKIGMVVRQIKSRIPSPDMLGLSPIYTETVMQRRGLVLLVGPTGSGKSTSMAAMLEYRNQYGSGHIVTIEDPIEYVFHHRNCIFTQREVGIDTLSYNVALKNVLRQSCDVVAIGEIRDRDTLESAMLFCETGHLVLATLHASNTIQAIERMLNFFSEEQHRHLLATLSQALRVIISQRLVETLNGSRVLASEILINQGLISEFIEQGKIKQIRDVIEKSGNSGMQTFDQCLFEMFKDGLISKDVALHEADNANNVRLRISQEETASIVMGKQPNFRGTTNYNMES
ncbi:MAG: PilT/PilU family type 4a pilus ATPase [Hyphomicrobiales bacterium]|nr:PilT/PilU family type 4a pilus ATPase [Hyphomicrobiales bacterium]